MPPLSKIPKRAIQTTVDAQGIVWGPCASKVFKGPLPSFCGWCRKKTQWAQSIAWPEHCVCINCHPGIETNPKFRTPPKLNVAGEIVAEPA